MITYQQAIRQRADEILGDRQWGGSTRLRRYTGIALNTASNAIWADVSYPPADRTRDDVIAYLLKAARDMGVLLTNAEHADFGIAVEQAITILREL